MPIHGTTLDYDVDDRQLENLLVSLSSNGQSRITHKLNMSYKTPEDQKGRATEYCLQELFSTLLAGVEEVRLVPCGTKADDDKKIDLVVYTATGRAFVFQVKSSKPSDETVKECGDVPIIWLDITQAQDRINILKGMTVFLARHVRLKPFVEEAFRKWASKRKQNKRFDLRYIDNHFTDAEMTTLELLLLAYRQRGEFVLK